MARVSRYGGAVANRLRRRTSDQTVLGSNPAVAAALSPWTRLFTPAPLSQGEAFTSAFIRYLAILVKYILAKKKNTSERGSRSFHAEAKSKPTFLHRHGAREKSRILNINSPTFLTPSQELVELNKLTEKKVGVTGHFETFFFKKPLFSSSNTYKNTQAVWSTFRGGSAKNLNHVFLRPFEHGFNKKIGTFMFKNQIDGATLITIDTNGFRRRKEEG